MTPTQHQAVSSRDRRIITIAGPGSGKTTVLIERLRRIISEEGPSRVAVMTFTTHAAAEIRRRLRGTGPAYCGTLHAYAYTKLLNHGHIVGIKKFVVAPQAIMDAALDKAMLSTKEKAPRKTVMEAASRNPTCHALPVMMPGDLTAMMYHRTLRESGYLDFDAIVGYATLLFDKLHPDFDHLLIDEAQDATLGDLNAYAKMGAKNVFMVGDPDQSIYGFRGARPDMLVAAAKAPGTTLITLQECFRCAPAVAEAADRVIARNTNRIPKRIIPCAQEHGEVTMQEFQTQDEELNAIADWARLRGDMQFAVICRTNFDVGRITSGLTARGLPVNTFDGNAVKGWHEAVDLLISLTSPQSQLLAFLHIKMTEGLIMAKAAQSQATRTGLPIPCALDPSTMTASDLVHILGLTETHRDAREVIAQIANDVGPLTKAHEFVATVRGHDGTKPRPRIEAAVVVITMHAAKGMEFQQVWLPGWSQRGFPRNASKPAELQEERRLAFVSITRAMQRVHISSTRRGVLNDYHIEAEDLGEVSNIARDAVLYTPPA